MAGAALLLRAAVLCYALSLANSDAGGLVDTLAQQLAGLTPVLGSPGGNAAAPPAWRVAAIRVDAGPLELAPQLSLLQGAGNQSFVRVEGKRFALGCKQFMPVGWNSFTLLEQAAELPHGSYGADYTNSGRAQVTQMLDDAQRAGLNTVRLWGFTTTTAYPLQLSPSVYDAGIFRGLDFILDEARKRSIFVVLVLGDWWTTPGGVNQYVSWSPTALLSEDFFSDPTCREHFKRNMLNMLSRTNSVNGRRYRDDPTIFAWELLNEPRCRGCGARLQAWIEEMASFLAVHDPNHLRTVGEEGFFGADDRGAGANPAAWAGFTGQSFYENHNLPSITHAAVHVWPQNWAIMGASGIAPRWFLSNWLSAHIAEADRMDKPLILEEFGHSSFPEWQRDGFFNSALSAIEASTSRGSAACGSSFWTWYSDADRARTSADQYAVYSTDAVFKRVAAHARALAAAARPVSCTGTAKA